MAAPQRMYGRKAVARMVGLTVRQLRRWIDQGKFPLPHRIGTVPRWFEDEILAWQLKARADEFEEKKK